LYGIQKSKSFFPDSIISKINYLQVNVEFFSSLT